MNRRDFTLALAIVALMITIAAQVQAQPGGCPSGCGPIVPPTPEAKARANLFADVYDECHQKWGEGPICDSYTPEHLVDIFRRNDWSGVTGERPQNESRNIQAPLSNARRFLGEAGMGIPFTPDPQNICKGTWHAFANGHHWCCAGYPMQCAEQ
jgi:hypothetical protein